jgi:nitroreductase
MNLYQAIAGRRSSRNFKPTAVSDQQMARIWEAVRQAPSACNLQPWHFLVVKSPEVRARVGKVLQPWAMTAPVIVIALGNKNTAWRRDGQSYHEVDVAIAVEHLILAAAAEGLGSCWICAFNRLSMSKALGLGPEWDPVVAIPIGYADDPSPGTERKPLKEIVSEL